MLSEAQLAERAKNVGGSEVAALFGCHPYKTELQLFLEKAGEIPPDPVDTDLVKWGNRLEEAIALGIAEDRGWKAQKVHRYVKHPSVPGWGCSLDYEVVGQERGVGILQVKNVGVFAYKKGWDEGEEEGAGEAPLHIELQVQHEIHARRAAWGAIGALVGGNTPVVIERAPDATVANMIGEKVAAFWERVRRGDPPEINPDRDLATLKKLYPYAVAAKRLEPEKVTPEVIAAAKELAMARAMAKEAKALEVRAQAVLLGAIGDAELIEFPDAVEAEGKLLTGLTFKQQSRAEYLVKESSFRVCRLTELKPEKPKRGRVAA